MTREEKKVIFASSLGTVFEWYDFYLYGSLAAIIAKQFFSGLDPTSAYIFALLAFAAGFLVRPFGAIVFGRLGDMIGRKYTFLVTILIMGASTFIVGLLPSYAAIGSAASTAVPPPTWPNTRRTASAAPTPPGSRPPPRWACSCRC
jgi:MFS family permease